MWYVIVNMKWHIVHKQRKRESCCCLLLTCDAMDLVTAVARLLHM